ncbi:uncharacterized protein DKFZp434B061 [Eurytemora carolleeae]|uniref:uncharacterized protein DKFZp434B061 n=1 Tax=Eurytemora carolleeae TaxID=1294199 RepID=UPI000C76D252|nr:uncharacterized protein DKFZp434B061 [Eurytemora carolleeae]|eukprot:XP_023334916.1 uncharacterized protein DKFZp434B061-like [Eurytemora affinis]
MPNNSNRYQQGNGLHLVNSTRTTSSLEGNGSTERLWDTLPSRRPDTRSSRTPSRRLGTMDQEPGTPSRRLETMNQGSPDASSDNLTQFRYPYLSSAYSLPRNCRLLKANRQISGTIRESLENLSSSSQNLAFTESRESLLKRYPSSSLCASPVSSPAPSRKFVGSYSCRNSPTRSTNQSSAPRRSETQSRYSSERSSRRTSPEHTSRGGTLDSQSRHGSPNSSSQIRTSRVFPEQNRYDDSLELIRPSTKNYSRDSVPSYSHYSNPLSVQSSRNTSPVSSGNSVYSARSSRHVSPSRYTPSHSARSSRNASPNRGYTPSHSVRSSRNASPNREYTPSHSARSSRNASPNRAYTPSHSARSSRNASPNRGYTPSYSARSSHYNSPVHYPSDYVSKSSRHSSPNKFPHAYSSLSSRDPSPASSYTSSSYKSSSRYVSERTDRLRSQEYSSSRNGSPLKTQPIRMQESPVSVRPATEVSSRASSPASKRGGSPSSRRSSIASLRSSTSSKHSQKRSKTPHSNNIVTKRKEEMFLPDTGGGAQCVVYVRETFQILNLDQQQTQDIPLELLRSISSNSVASILQPPSAKSNERIEIGNKTEYDSTEASNLDLKKRNLDSVSNNSGSDGKQPNHTDTEKQTFQFNTASRDSLQTLLLSLRKPKEKSVNDEIEKRNVTDVTKDDYDDDDDERVEDREDLDDSARAESIVSITSTNSTSRSRENKDRDDEVRDPHSTIRRQSVIIEGLSMEAEDLKKKVQSLEEELSSIPMVEELQGKLCQGLIEEKRNEKGNEIIILYLMILKR